MGLAKLRSLVVPDLWSQHGSLSVSTTLLTISVSLSKKVNLRSIAWYALNLGTISTCWPNPFIADPCRGIYRSNPPKSDLSDPGSPSYWSHKPTCSSHTLPRIPSQHSCQCSPFHFCHFDYVRGCLCRYSQGCKCLVEHSEAPAWWNCCYSFLSVLGAYWIKEWTWCLLCSHIPPPRYIKTIAVVHSMLILIWFVSQQHTMTQTF